MKTQANIELAVPTTLADLNIEGKLPNLEQTVALMKAEILRDIAIGRVPKTVESFSELYDYVDANCYGGFCDDKYASEMRKWYNFTNAAQLATDQWLRSTYETEVLGTTARSPQDVDQYYHLQEYNPKGDNWIPRVGTRSLTSLLEYKKWAEERGETVRCVVIVQHIIA